jgi:hypothetical protein
MRRRQQGITFLGWLVLLIPIAIVGYVGIRVTPVLLNYVKVARVLEQVKKEFSATDGITREALAASIAKRFDVDYVESPSPKDVSVHKTGDGWEVSVSYESVTPLIANASLLLQFDKSVTIP